MAIFNLLLKDSEKKECQVLFHLRPDREELITHNIAAIVKSGKPHIQLETVDEISIPESLISRGWKKNDGLYDTVILLYNRDNPKSPLTAWC